MYILKVALNGLISIIIWVIIIKSILSWFPSSQLSRVYQFLDEFTYPIEEPIRRAFGRYMNGPIDFSPMIAIFLLIFIRRLIFILL